MLRSRINYRPSSNVFADLKSENEVIINNGGKIKGDCFEFPTGAAQHQYIDGGQFNHVPQEFDQRVRTMNHTAAVALASNYTRSVTLNYGFSGHYQSNVPNFHGYTHSSDNNAKPALDEISSFQINMLAHLYRELESLGILSETLVVFSVHDALPIITKTPQSLFMVPQHLEFNPTVAP